MAIAGIIAELRAEGPILIGSAAVVLVMVGLAWLLGFRAKKRLDQQQLARLAEDMHKDDSGTDIIGYAALGGEISNDEQ